MPKPPWLLIALLVGVALGGLVLRDARGVAMAQVSAPYAWLAQNPALLEQLSEPTRARVQRRSDSASASPPRVGQQWFASASASAPAPSLAALANVLVNDPAQDTGAQDTQANAALVLGAGSSVIAAFNDSGSAVGGVNRLTGVARSSDGGASFTDLGALPFSIDGDAGDPVLARDSASGTVYLSTLARTNEHKLALFRSVDDGVTWSTPVNSAPGFSAGTDVLDKPWLAVDPFPGLCRGTVYQMWRTFSAVSARSGMAFSRSTDGGATWGPSGGVPLGLGGQGAFLTVGPDHSVYALWYDTTTTPRRIVLRRSLDCGQTFGAPVTVAALVGTGVNGSLGLEFRTNSYPQAAVNPINRQLYVVYADSGIGGDRADIFLRQSIDFGQSWGAAVRVNDDTTTTDQFSPALAVTPDGSGLFVGYYSRQLDPANRLIDRWGRIAAVANGAVQFGSGFRVSTESFPAVLSGDPVVTPGYIGEYDTAVADNAFFYCAWADGRDRNLANTRNQQNIRFAKIPRAGPGPLLGVGAVTVGGGDANGTLDPNECDTLQITLLNLGTETATGVSATLTSATAGVTVTAATSSYPSIAAGGSGMANTPFGIRIAASVPCGSMIELTLSVTALSGGAVTLPVRLRVGGASAPATFSAATLTPVPDNGTVDAPLTVSGISGTLATVTVSLYISHTATSDLDISLIAPDGTVVELSTDNGGLGVNYGTSCANATTFDDDAPLAIAASAATPPYVGRFKPESPLAALAGKSGAAVNGTWKLRVADDLAGTVGALWCWSLNISSVACSAGAPCSTAIAPSVDGVSPSVGPEAGGTAVTISGANFAAGATVSFGGVAASGVSVVGPTTITAVTPPHATGSVAVTVANTDGQSATLPSSFTYGLPLAAMSVSGSAWSGGAPVLPGTSITASIGTTVCGTATTSGAGLLSFTMQVRSATEQAGCGTDGTAVAFRVGGVDASPSVTFRPGTSASVRLTVGASATPAPTPTVTPTPTPLGTPTPTPTPAPGGGQPMTIFGAAMPTGFGTPVKAFVGGVECGSVTTAFGGWFTLPVRSFTQQPGCGTAGATVTFTVGGVAAAQSVAFVSGGSASLTLTQGSGPTPSPTPAGTPTPTPLGTPPPPPTPSPTPSGASSAMTLSGRAFLNGTLAPPGTVVQAYIGGVACSDPVVITTRFFRSFTLTVRPSAQQPGCGTLGATVTFTLNGLPAVQSVPFAPGGTLDLTLSAP